MPDASSIFVFAKTVHLITLISTISGFILRGIWMLRDSPLLQARLTKILPHINDTLLLISALWSAALLGQYPFVNDWLTAKVLGAIAYILLGGIALNYGRTRTIRGMAFVGALLSFAYVVGVALTKNPALI